MRKITDTVFTDERSLFGERDLEIVGCTFDRGESPLKECRALDISDTRFLWKYPLWYCKNVNVRGGELDTGARAGMWYTENIAFRDTAIRAPKSFRRSSGITLENVEFTDARETLWSCRKVTLKNVKVLSGDYLAKDCEDVEADSLTLDGNYAFDGAKNIIIRNSTLTTKDAFWNSERVTVYSSTIRGEYLGWNSKDLTLIDCTIESLQGMCYVENLKMVGCRLVDTALAFECSSVDADISSVDSVFDPQNGVIKAGRIGNLIITRDRTDPSSVKIICDDIVKRSDSVNWEEIL